MTLGVNVAGSLPAFPCGGSCRTDFSGGMTHAGTATVTTGWSRISGVTSYADPTKGLVMTFAMSTATVTGWADYVEPSTPLCPGKGSAAGRAYVYAFATGRVTSASSATVIGHVDAISLSLEFTYDRVASTAAILASGSMRIYFHTDTTSGYADVLVRGGGDGEFVFNPVQAANGCLNAGPLDYEVLANIGLSTNAAFYTM